MRKVAKSESSAPPSGAAARTSTHVDKRDSQIALLEQRLAEAEESLASLLAGSVDLVIERAKSQPDFARVVQEALRSGIRAGIATEIALIDADRMAALVSLTAGMAHQINNPLAYITTNVTFAIDELTSTKVPPGRPDLGRPTAEVLSALTEAREGAERIREIVLNLKAFSRGGADLRPIDVHAPIEIACKMAESEIVGRAKLVKCFGDVPRIMGNEARLSQLFFNLLINAAQAVPEGDKAHHEIVVTTERSETGVIVEIRDTGRGMAPESLERIFDPFVTLKPAGQGAGLGLAICRTIAHAHAGHILVASELGRGSTFRVAFGRMPDSASRTNAGRASAKRSERGRVLVIDDDPALASSLRRMLTLEHDVEVALNAHDALDHIRTDAPYDVILCDVMMPEVSGIDLYEKLRALRPEALEKLVFMTAGAFTARAQAFLESVPNLRVYKPFEAEKLRALVRDRLALARR